MSSLPSPSFRRGSRGGRRSVNCLPVRAWIANASLQIRTNTSAKSVLYRLLVAGNQPRAGSIFGQSRRVRSPAWKAASDPAGSLSRRCGRASSSPTTLVPALDSLRRLGPGRRSFDLAGPPPNDLQAGAGARQPRPRRGDRAGDRPRDDRRSARADGTGRPEAAASLRSLRRALALPLSRGAREGDARRCGTSRLESAISRDLNGPRAGAREPEKGRTALKLAASMF